MSHIYAHLETYPNVDDPHIGRRISSLREFDILKERMMDGAFGYQEFILRFMSKHTNYKYVFEIAETGCGKSIIIINLCRAHRHTVKHDIEYRDGATKVKLDVNSGKPLILLRNKSGKDNFIKEIMKHDPDLIKRDVNAKMAHARRRVESRFVGEYYDIQVYNSFANELERMSDEQIREKYSNRFIFYDEVHNLSTARIRAEILLEQRSLSNEDENNLRSIKKIWKEMRRLAHVTVGVRIVHLTATPILNERSELISIVGLTPYVKIFDSNIYRHLNDIERLSYTEERLRGRIMYVRQDVRRIPRRNLMGAEPYINGKPLGIKLVCHRMSPFQLQAYCNTYRSPERHGVEMDLRQCGTFAFPDGSYGVTGFEKYVVNDGTRFRFTSEMLRALRKNGLQHYSILFYRIIRNILNAYKVGKVTYVYDFFYDTGVVLLGLCLEWYTEMHKNTPSFTQYDGDLSMNDMLVRERIPRYAIIGQDQSTRHISNIKELYNARENKYGEYLFALFITDKSGESSSFYNARVEQRTATWSNAKGQQIDGRSARPDSLSTFDDDLNAPERERREVDVYYHATCFDDPHYTLGEAGLLSKSELEDPPEYPATSISMKMYTDSVVKVRGDSGDAMRDLKRIALDGVMLRKRNVLKTDRPCSMESDFNIETTYSIIGNEVEIRNNELIAIQDYPIEYANYHKHYASEEMTSITNDICELLQMHTTLSLLQLQQTLNVRPDVRGYASQTILHTIANIVMNRICVRNRMSIECIIVQIDDVLTLMPVSDMSSQHQTWSSASHDAAHQGQLQYNALDTWYTEHLYITDESTSTTFSNNMINNNIYSFLHRYRNDKDMFQMKLIDLSSFEQAYILEAILTKNYDILSVKHDDKRCKWILEAFHTRYFVLDSPLSIVHTLYQIVRTKGTSNRNQRRLVPNGKLRIFKANKGVWKYASSDEDVRYIEAINAYIDTNRNSLFQRSHVIAIVNSVDKKLRFADSRLINSNTSKRKSASAQGRHATGYKMEILIGYLYEFHIKDPKCEYIKHPEIDNDYTDRDMLAYLRDERGKDMTDTQLLLCKQDKAARRYYFAFCSDRYQSKTTLVSLLYRYLEDHELVLYV